MICHSNENIPIKDNVGNVVGYRKCEEEAVKKCRHGFATCNKHYHGCKHEEKEALK